MLWRRRTYLDSAAGVAANPSSPHEEGRAAKQQLETAREKIARLTEVKTDDVVFTSGATEANALAILGLARPGVHMLYLPSAHASVVENMALAAERGVAVEPLPIKDARVDVRALTELLRPETVLVSMDAVCGETGVVWNTREVADVLQKFRTGAKAKGSAQAARPIPHPFPTAPVLHVDASQAPLAQKTSRAHFGADLMTLDASKVGETRGVGCLIAHRTIPLAPLYRGGGQERALRPGSEAPELAAAFAQDLAKAVACREAFAAEAHGVRAHLIETLATIPDLYINEGKVQAPHILNLSLPGRDTDYLVALLDKAGFAVSTRSACETDSEEGSRAVYALTNDSNRAKTTLRISWGPGTTKRDLNRFARALIRETAFVDRAGAS